MLSLVKLSFLTKLFAPRPKFTTKKCQLCPKYVDVEAQLHGRGFLCTTCWLHHTRTDTGLDLMERFPEGMAAWGKHLRRMSSLEIGGMGGAGLDMREQRAAAQDLMRESIAASFLAFDAAKAGRHVEQQELAKRALDLKTQAEELVTASEEASRAMEEIIPHMEGHE